MVADYASLKADMFLVSDSNDAIISNILIRLAAIEARLDYLEGSLVVTAVDVTGSGNTTIVCTDSLTVTMASIPLDRDTVSIKAYNGDKIIINGNGHDMDGQPQFIIRANKRSDIKTGLTMRYSDSLSAWSLI